MLQLLLEQRPLGQAKAVGHPSAAAQIAERLLPRGSSTHLTWLDLRSSNVQLCHCFATQMMSLANVFG